MRCACATGERKRVVGSVVGLFLCLIVPWMAAGAPEVNRAEQLSKQHAVRSVDEGRLRIDALMAIYDDPAATPAEKAAALCGKITTECVLGERLKVDDAMARAEATYDLYNRVCRGKDPRWDAAMCVLYARAMVYQIQNGRKERLGDALKSLDAVPKTAKAAEYAEVSERYRALAYLYAGETEKGEAVVKGLLTAKQKPTPDLFLAISDVYRAQQRYADSLAFAVQGLQLYAGDDRAATPLSERLAAVIPQAGLDEAKLLATLTQVVTYPKAVKPILNMLIARRTEAGDAVGALAYAKLYYDLAPLDEIEGAIEVVSRCMRTVDMDVVRTNQFLEFQKFGPGGPDGKAAGKEALVNPLAGVKSPLPPETLKALGDLAAKTVPAGERVYEPLRDRGTLALALGRPEEALALYRAAYSAASIGQVKEVSALAPRALKAIDGGVWRVNLYLKYQKCGPAGEDGTAGNADDLTDPLAQEKLPPLPEDVTRALGAVAAKSGGAMNLCEARGYAFLAMGQYGKGFNQMRAAFAAASSDPKMLARGIEDVASAIKAYDGHVHRANQYLLYQKQNGKTPDGKAMENPLPVIMAEIGVAR